MVLGLLRSLEPSTQRVQNSSV